MSVRMPEVVHDDDTITFPLKCNDGQTRDYTLQPCSIADWEKVSRLGLSVVQVMAGRGKSTVPKVVQKYLDEMSQDEIYSLVIGPDTFQAMKSDGVSIRDLQRVFSVACLWYSTGMDHEIAMASWSGKASTTPSGKDGVEANTAKPPASGNGTSTPKKSSPAASRGKKSGRTAS